MREEQTKILIVGSGLVGLTTSLLLQQQQKSTIENIKFKVIEKHSSFCNHPRSRGLNARTMEIMRSLSLEDKIKETIDESTIIQSKGIYSGRTLLQVIKSRSSGISFLLNNPQLSLGLLALITFFGLLYSVLPGGWFSIVMIALVYLILQLAKKIKNYIKNGSPCSFTRITQDVLEPLLYETARQRGVDIELNQELVEIQKVTSEDEEESNTHSKHYKVIVKDRVSGENRIIWTDYIIGCDGSKSTVREQVGIGFQGKGELSQQLNIYFQSKEMESLTASLPLSMCLVENEHVRGQFASVNNKDLWVLHVSMKREETLADYPKERCIKLIRDAVGLETLGIDEIKGTMPWWSTVRTATRFSTPDRRVFLAGDAAHVVPPWGGFGANSGCADAQNLVWKLVYVIHQYSDPSLLDTYEEERRPIIEHVSSLAANMNDSRGLMKMNSISTIPTFLQLIPYMIVGYGYKSNIIIGDEDNNPNSLPTPKSYDLCGRAGTRIPHKWINVEKKFTEENEEDYQEEEEEEVDEKIIELETISTLDLVDPCRYTLITYADDMINNWDRLFGKVFKDEDNQFKPFNRMLVTKEDRHISIDWRNDFGLEYGQSILIRPDGFVAWRSSPKDPMNEYFIKNTFLPIIYSNYAMILENINK